MTSRMTAQPINRNAVRRVFGKIYYRTRRHLFWIFSGGKLAKKQDDIRLPHCHVRHKTPLLRKLKDVDMYLQFNKITNLKLAAEKINNVVIYPGETFSFWKLVGKPTAGKGYLPGMVLYMGKFKAGTGGGLCQMSNLIYWMTIHTPLTVTERHRHSFDVFPDSNRTQPFGSGATLSYNYLDLCIKNNTSEPFQLHIEINDQYLEGAWTCSVKPSHTYQVYETEHHINSEYWGGYSRHNVIRRKVFDLDGKEIGDEYVVENHALMMYAPFLKEASEDYKVSAVQKEDD